MSDAASAPKGSCRASASEDDAGRQIGKHGGETVDIGGSQHDVHPPDCTQFAGEAFISSSFFCCFCLMPCMCDFFLLLFFFKSGLAQFSAAVAMQSLHGCL